MIDTKLFMDVLNEPKNFVLEGNQESINFLKDNISNFIKTEKEDVVGKISLWHLPHTQFGSTASIKAFPMGHLAFYGSHGRRILGTDPDGTPLHECEWRLTEEGKIKMTRARVRLDCMQWGGIIAEDTDQVAELKLPLNPEGIEPAPDDLRKMAAEMWGVPLDDMRYFYPDKNFKWNESGHVLISNKKDGVYILADGTFKQSLFVSYMGTIPWERIDLLNVVELYQSTLTGTGGAAFDMIWGLCDDQRVTDGLIPLRYRGIPTYPIRQAYGLFCAYYRAEVHGSEDPYDVFMDSQRGYEIAWWLRPDPPWRFFDKEHRLCITVQGQKVQKVTAIDDPAAVPYYYFGMKGFAPCDRTVGVEGSIMKLRDGDQTIEIPLYSRCGTIQDTSHVQLPNYPFGWRKFFKGTPPKIDPVAAWTTSLRFTDDESIVAEDSTQLFVLDQAYDYINQVPGMAVRMSETRNVLIHNFDPVCAGFVNPDNWQRRYTILYNRPVWAQKNAQAIWDQAAKDGNLKVVENVEFLPEQTNQASVYEQRYELIYRWIPFNNYNDPSVCEAIVKEVSDATLQGGLALVAGPPDLVRWFESHKFCIICYGRAKDMRGTPSMLEHLRVHPKTQVNPKITVVLGEKCGTC
ncbi:MAG: hypothetical protein HYW14_04450 [Planctomycetes bacterium]|nr:hypothetical protein [Planctomycetota bacterium]